MPSLDTDDLKELPFTIKNADEAGPGVVMIQGHYLARICRAALSAPAAHPRPTEPQK